jgi:APA family basic amino acid/polyamine antiporter
MPQSTSGNAPKQSRTQGRLLRILGVGFGLAMIVGGTVGSGILRTPGEIAGHLGSYGWIVAVWLLGGAYALVCTVSVTELGTMLPFAGGWYVYSRRALGEYSGFVVGASDWMVQTASVSYLTVAFGEFAGELQPALRGHVKLVGIAMLSALMLLNWIGLRSGSRTQKLTSLAKALALLAFVGACFVVSPHTPTSVFAAETVVPLRGGLLVALVLSLQSIVVTYDGWYSAIYFTEEDENPAKNLPRSSIIGVLACIAIYMLVNFALFRVLPMGQLAASRMPVADAAAALFGAIGRRLILVVSLISAVSTINATLLQSPRILFAMARDRLVPGWVASVNRGGTPAVALLIGTLVASLLALSGSFDTLVSISSFLMVAVYLSGFMALFLLRAREPNLPRPFRAWAYPFGNLAVLVASAAFLVSSVIADFKDALFTLVLVALTVPLYLLITRSNQAEANSISNEVPSPAGKIGSVGRPVS